jgi:preprotein translocase subunit SecA
VENSVVSRSIRSAQTQVESQNFEIRKDVLKYDDVLNRQRQVIYGERRTVLEGADLHEQVRSMIDEVIASYVTAATADGYPEEWDLEKLWRAFKQLFPITLSIDSVIEEAGGDKSGLSAAMITEMVQENAQEAYDRRETDLTPDNMREIERRVVLSVLDRKWREHLYEMDYLREGIGLRAMAQRDPLVEYQREGYDMFNSMMDGIREESVGNLFNLQIEFQENPIVEEVGAGAQLAFGGSLPGVATGGAQQAPAAAAQVAQAPAAPARAARPLPPPQPAPAAPPAAFGKRPGASQAGGQPAGGRSRGRHAADGRGHATAAGRGQAATQSSSARETEAAAELEETDTIPQGQAGAQPVLPERLQPRRPQHLQYSAPSETGGVERHGETADDPYATVGRNDLCPCGSGRKYKRCHGGRS